MPRSQPNWVRHPNPSLPIGAKSAPCLVFMARDHPLQSARPVPYEVVRQKMMRAMSTKVVPSHRTSQVPGGISDILASPQPHRDHLLQFLLGPDACPKFLHRAALKTENLSSDRQFLNSNTACNPPAKYLNSKGPATPNPGKIHLYVSKSEPAAAPLPGWRRLRPVAPPLWQQTPKDTESSRPTTIAKKSKAWKTRTLKSDRVRHPTSTSMTTTRKNQRLGNSRSGNFPF